MVPAFLESRSAKASSTNNGCWYRLLLYCSGSVRNKFSNRVRGFLAVFALFLFLKKKKMEDKVSSVCKVDELSDLEFYPVDYTIRNHERASMAFHSSSPIQSYSTVRNNADSVLIELKTLIQVLKWNLWQWNGLYSNNRYL